MLANRIQKAFNGDMNLSGGLTNLIIIKCWIESGMIFLDVSIEVPIMINSPPKSPSLPKRGDRGVSSVFSDTNVDEYMRLYMPLTMEGLSWK